MIRSGSGRVVRPGFTCPHDTEAEAFVLSRRSPRPPPRPPQLGHPAQQIEPERRAERNGRGGEEPPHHMRDPGPPSPVRDLVVTTERILALPAQRKGGEDSVWNLQDRRRVQEEVSRLEMVHGLRPPVSRTKGVLETFIDRAGGNARSSFVCSRGDLLAGDMAKVLGLSRTEALFVDRIAFAAIAASAVTAWREALVPGRTDSGHSPIRLSSRRFFAFWNQLLLISAAFLVIPEATKHAMGTLKRSLHSCYYRYSSCRIGGSSKRASKKATSSSSGPALS